MTELANVGCHTFLRMGTIGSLQENIRCGDVVISTPATGRIAVKVINHYGDEVLKVFEV